MQIKELKPKQFENFVENNILGNYCQTSAYAKLMEENGYKSLYIGLIDEYNHIIAASLLLIKKLNLIFKYAYAPKGFILDYSNKELIQTFTTKLKDFLKKKRIRWKKDVKEI